jgi:hypothetical protein
MRVALILSLFALGLAGCGGDDNQQATTIPTVPLTVPGEDTTSSSESTDTTVDTTPDTATPAPAPTPTPTPAPTPAQPEDSPQNDTAPPPGSEAQKFEDFCTQNPGAC